MHSLSKFNFPSLPAALERFGAPLRSLALPVGVALGLHGLWLLGASLGQAERPRNLAIASGDDTPELLRFSRRSASPAPGAALPGRALSLVPLPLDSTLPPPPPDLAFGPLKLPLEGTLKSTANDKSARGRSSQGAASPGMASALGARKAQEFGSTEGLPKDPLQAFKLAVALPASAQEPSGPAADASSAAAPTPAAPTAAAAAIARRHLRLSSAGENPYLKLWQQARPLPSRPERLAELPEGVEVRSIAISTAIRLGFDQPHGISVTSPTGLLLLWVDGNDLWLISQKA